ACCPSGFPRRARCSSTRSERVHRALLFLQTRSAAKSSGNSVRVCTFALGDVPCKFVQCLKQGWLGRGSSLAQSPFPNQGKSPSLQSVRCCFRLPAAGTWTFLVRIQTYAKPVCQ